MSYNVCLVLVISTVFSEHALSFCDVLETLLTWCWLWLFYIVVVAVVMCVCHVLILIAIFLAVC